MKIVLVSPIPPPYGGIATWTNKYLGWAKSNGMNVETVNTAVIGKRRDKLNSKRSFFDEVIRTINIFYTLNSKIRNFNPEIIHINSPCKKAGIIRDYICAKIAKRKNKKVIVHYRCNIEDQVKEDRLQLYFLQKISTIADLNIVLNTPSKEFLENQTDRQIVILPNFISESNIINTTQYRKKIKSIVFVGHVHEMKGILDIISVAQSFPEIIFNIVGPLEINKEKQKVPANINFHGQANADQIKNHLLEADVFLFPTFTEGFSNSLLEAMSVGLPIITTPVGANKDMIETSGGILVNTKSPNEIIQAINKMENIKIRESMGQWNIDKVRENYTRDKIMTTLEEMYKNLKND